MTGRWKAGGDPSLTIVCEIADKLNMSLDELVLGKQAIEFLSDSDREWLDIISGIPKDKQQVCKDFLRTHITVRNSRESRRA